MELYHIEGLSFAYAGQSEPALHGIDLTLHAGEFITLCGLSGSGKSTLLRQLKTALAPNGTRTGTVYFTGRALEEIPAREQAARIGYVHQRGEDQLVTDRVWHELAFGPESLGMEPSVIRRRVAEIAAFFGLEELFHRETAALSGGQKQLVDLAAALVLQPDILLLDEPTAQLDPIAAAELLAALSRINRELGTGILLSEQRLEEALPISDRALVLDGGHLIADGTPHEVAGQLGRSGHELFCAMPAAARVWMTVEQEKTCPISVREGRERLAAFAAGHALGPVPPAPDIMPMGDAAAQLSGIWHRYAADAPDVLRELSFTVRRGELLALLGGNGAGKSTVLKLLAGQERAYRGAVRVCGRTALLPQDVQTVFARKTVAEDLAETGADAAALERVTALCRLQSLLGRHPYDLSGGEQQRAALAKLLLMEPELLLLDEPTRGLDAAFRQELAQLLKRLCAEGVTVVIVSHDVEFCAEHAARCALLFDGAIVSDGTAREFFAGSRFYTTAVNRMGRDVVPDAVTVADLITACGGTPAAGEGQQRRTEVQGKAAPCDPACGLPERARSQSRQHLSLPSALTWALLPLTLVLGVRFFGSRGHYALSLLLLAEAMLAFFLAFERRRPAARELVLLAVLCALGTAGRAAFFMLPQCKPVLALTVTAGAALGGESGFLVGAVTMLVSNMLFSQGPWTPWQMFGMGLCGFLAGCVFRGGRLAPGRWTLSSFGALCALVVYGPLLNASSALLAAGTLTREGLLAYCASGLPMDCIHAAATFAFAWLFSEPMMEKLVRWQQKYG